ncbi:HAD family hydrolase [Ruminococcaceae bacterium OttesenSCG-928-A11]|nr:HAD family hydrolase [Ruminococcaceae bacterium OttesenSCG-928-A11]
MDSPRMIIFDYGQTLVCERQPFDGVAGNAALLAHAVENPRGITPQQMRAEEEKARAAMGQNDPAARLALPLEIHHHVFQRFFFDYLGLKLDLTPDEAERAYWDAAAPGIPAPGIEKLLDLLAARGIRTGVISNLTFSGATLKARIDRLLPNHRFEFILASSEYVFRKPSPYLFTLALNKAELPAKDIWFCGDNFAADIEGAAAVGMFPVWYKDAAPPRPVAFDYLHIKSWDELAAKLK